MTSAEATAAREPGPAHLAVVELIEFTRFVAREDHVTTRTRVEYLGHAVEADQEIVTGAREDGLKDIILSSTYALRVVVPSSTVIVPKPASNLTSLEEPDRSITSSEPVRVPVALVMTVLALDRVLVSKVLGQLRLVEHTVGIHPGRCISNPADAVENSFPATSTWEATTDRPAPWPITIMSSLLSV